MFAFLSRKPSPRLVERVAELEQRQDRLELQMDDLKSLYRRLLSRHSQDNVQPREEVARPEAVPTATGAHGSSPHGLLNPRQREIQQDILRRRAGG